MAVTYVATRISDGRRVALKVPRGRWLQDPTFVIRFLQEAHLGARLSSPYIARVFDSGQDGEVPWLAMELLEGLTLREALDAAGALSRRRALQTARDVAAALEHAHARGVIHRDLKPENIMLADRRPLKVMDFGIAKVLGQPTITTAGVFLGSPAYAAPETADPPPVDHRADLYALGIMLFEMLVGRVPFTGRSAVEVLLAHRQQALPGPEQLPRPVAPSVWRLVEHLAAKRPSDRPPDARAVRLALEMLLR